jgi:hypothetical protein
MNKDRIEDSDPIIIVDDGIDHVDREHTSLISRRGSINPSKIP